MSKAIYADIVKAKNAGRRLLAVLLDPDKIDWENLAQIISKIKLSAATHVFVGGSHVTSTQIDMLVTTIKRDCALPIVLFPGNPSQISDRADAILFLSLISGRNPDYLIGHHVQAAPLLKKTTLEIISTGYILVESGRATAVQKVSQTLPLDRNKIQLIVATAQAGEMLGNKLIYLEAGSGADCTVPQEVIEAVATNSAVPIIVGGGIRSKSEMETAYRAGAALVVIGTAFENNIHFFD